MVACAFFLMGGLSVCSAASPTVAKPRTPDEDVNSAEVRLRERLLPGANLLFNGWGVTPAGAHVKMGDMPLKLVIAPDKKAVLALCAGFNNVGVNVVSLDEKRTVQYHKLDEVFNGLAFSRDGKSFYVSGGDKGVLYVFDYADGKATFRTQLKLASKDTGVVFLAGLSMHPKTGRLYVCNEANHEVWVVNVEKLVLEQRISVGQHPHSCMVGGDPQYLYVSNWGSRSVSIIDTKTNRRVRDIAVGLRPNDMALAPDGRLFVACAG